MEIVKHFLGLLWRVNTIHIKDLTQYLPHSKGSNSSCYHFYYSYLHISQTSQILMLFFYAICFPYCRRLYYFPKYLLSLPMVSLSFPTPSMAGLTMWLALVNETQMEVSMYFTMILAMIPAAFYIDIGPQVKILWSTATDAHWKTCSISNKLFGKQMRLQSVTIK